MGIKSTGRKIVQVTLRGEALWRALRYENAKAFQRDRARGLVPIPLYPIPGQGRAYYALRADVEKFLAEKKQRAAAGKEGSSMS